MPIIDVGGMQIEVGDEFNSLTPEQKNAVVLELYQRKQAGAPKENVRTVGPKVMEDAPPKQEPQQPGIVGRALDKWGTQLRGVQAGFFNDWDDEITAGAMAPFQAGWDAITGKGFDIGRAYSERQKSLDAAKQAAMQRNPLDAFVGRVGGGIAQSVAGGKAIEAAGKSIPVVAQGARSWGNFINKHPIIGGGVVGAGQGAVSGAGNAKPGERMSGAKWGAATGFGAGLAGGAIGNVVGRMTAKTPKGYEGILDDGSAIYKQADDMNVIVNPRPLQQLSAKVRADNAAKLKITSSTDKAAGVLQYIDDLTSQGPLRLRDIEDIRQFINDANDTAYRAGDRVNGRILSSIKDSFDEAVDSMPQSSVRGADKATAWGLYQKARSTWHMGRKQEIIDELYRKAQNQATGFENGLVVQFRQLANNTKKWRLFNKEEQAAINRVINTRDMSALARAFAWADPTKTLGTLLTLTAGATGGVGAGAAVAAAGSIATPIANAARRGRATDVSRVIQGIPLPRAPQYIRSAPGIAGSMAGSWAGRSK